MTANHPECIQSSMFKLFKKRLLKYNYFITYSWSGKLKDQPSETRNGHGMTEVSMDAAIMTWGSIVAVKDDIASRLIDQLGLEPASMGVVIQNYTLLHISKR